MVREGLIEGRYVRLRSISEEDAEFTVAIRQDEKKTKFLHKVENDLEKQLSWIRRQRQAQGDYFFIAERLDGKRVGTVGIYEIEGKVGHLGRLLMIGNPYQTFEAVLLSMKFAYDELKLEELFGDVSVGNSASLNLSEAVGIHFNEPVYAKERNAYVQYGSAYREEFPRYAEKIEKLIYRG